MSSGPASYAQTRIWYDERRRFCDDKLQVAVYNMPFAYGFSSENTLSISQLHQALQLTINKHQSLRTSLDFDSDKNLLIQRIINQQNNTQHRFPIIKSTYKTDGELNNIMQDEQTNSQHFDLAQGLVFRCHIVYYKQISSNNVLFNKDVLIFNFHHALFDFPSIDIFLDDLNQAYTTGQLPINDDTDPSYLDCKYKYF
jgi:hypothetical protein